MRNQLFLALAAVSVSGAACKWTDFDDLEAETSVRSTQDPEIGATDYAVAIAGVTQGTSGGTLAVISDDNANYSTIVYNAKGEATIGANPLVLGNQMIPAIADAPVFVTDPTGRIGLIERSSAGGNFAVLFGSATAPAGIEFAAVLNPAPSPDAAVFIPGPSGNDLVFAAGNTLYTIPAMGGTVANCSPNDNTMMPLQVAALGHDGTNLVVWTKAGALITYDLDDLAACTATMTPVPGTAVFPAAMAFMPTAGARVHVLGGHAILTGHPATSRSGSVIVVKLADMTPVGATQTVEGLRTSTIADFAGDTYLVLGVPDRAIGGVAAGEVDVIAFNPTSGVLDGDATLNLHDADPESGQLFGRTVTTMNFNGETILVVGADSEVFAYYRTALYDDRR